MTTILITKFDQLSDFDTYDYYLINQFLIYILNPSNFIVFLNNYIEIP